MEPTKIDAEIAELKAKHGSLIVVELGEHTLGFRPADKAKIMDVQRQLGKKPDLSVEIMLNFTEFCCVLGKEHYPDLARLYPLAFAGSDGVGDAIINMAKGNVRIREA